MGLVTMTGPDNDSLAIPEDMRIKTGADLARARKELGWSVFEMGAALRLVGTREQRGKRVREMEDGIREVSGPVSVAVEAFLTGFNPEE